MAKTDTKKQLTPEEWSSLTLVTPPFIMSYPHLFEKGTYNGKETSYNFTMLFKKTTDITKLTAALDRAKTLNWGADKAKWPKGYRRAIKDGDEMEDENYAGYWVVSATSVEPRPVVDFNKQKVLNKAEIYGGVIACAIIQAAVYTISKDNIGEKFYFKAVQKIEDGEKLGKGGSVIDSFDDLNKGSDDKDNYESAESMW